MTTIVYTFWYRITLLPAYNIDGRHDHSHISSWSFSANEAKATASKLKVHHCQGDSAETFGLIACLRLLLLIKRLFF